MIEPWDPDARPSCPTCNLTVREEFSAMVQRMEAAIVGTSAGYTPRIRGAECAFELVAARHDRAEASREQVSEAIRLVEDAWYAELARVRRMGRTA